MPFKHTTRERNPPDLPFVHITEIVGVGVVAIGKTPTSKLRTVGEK